MTKRLTAVVAGVAAALLLAACGGTDVADPGDVTLDSTPTAESTPEVTDEDTGGVTADVTITECNVDPDWGVEISGTITNPLDVRADVAGVIEVLNSAGDRVDEAYFWEEKVAAGQKVKWDTSGFETEGLPAKVTCSLLDATAIPTE
jgi:hypothetical protein